MNYPLDTAVIEKLWARQAAALPWYNQWNNVFQGTNEQTRWFVGGKINASFACVDVHVQKGRGDKIAIYWHGENGENRVITYVQLYVMVNNYAALLRQYGVRRGDIVVVYLPMIPEAAAMMLAIARLGALHAVVFSGFSAAALRQRINDTRAKVVVTTDIGYRRGKILQLKSIVEQAVDGLACVEKVLVVERDEKTKSSYPSTSSGRAVDEDSKVFNPLMVSLSNHMSVSSQENLDKAYVEPEKVAAEDPLFVLYTSGTTGTPKGILHSTGGYLAYVYSTIKWSFDINEDSIYWCTADIGWITGHSYVVYGPLLHGASMVMVEGAPDYPTSDVWWSIIEKYRVSIFYTSPTALRMFMKMDEASIVKYDLSSLSILGSVGEPINPEVWRWYDRVIGRGRCPIIDTWWQTETGGFMISPTATQERVTLKPGSATLPLPGIIADVVDERGESLAYNTKGFLVIKRPWPGMAIGILNDEQKLKDIYWSKFPGMYYSGDYARKDVDGYFWLLGRADEVLSIAGHRVGTAEIESAALVSGYVAEVAAIPINDEVKGEQIVLFIVLKNGIDGSPHIEQEIILSVRKEIGAFVTPQAAFFVESLPKTRSGKIMRRLLKAVMNGQMLGDVSTLEDEVSIEQIKRLFDTFLAVVKR